MSIKIKELPELERPYEKLERYGEKALSDAELLAIIIKSGNKNETSVQVAQKLLSLNKTTKENLEYLHTLSLEELMEVNGIGKVKAIQLKAVGEIAIRMFSRTKYQKTIIRKPGDLASLLLNSTKFEEKEIAKKYTFVNISAREILVEPIKLKAPKYILIHNHPGRSTKPSRADIETTKSLYKASQILGIELLDHIILAGENYTSIMSDWIAREELEEL